MFYLKRDPDSTLRMIGALDDSAQLETLFASHTGDLILIGREVSRINSAGIRAWRDFFQQKRASGVKLRFRELSPALVEQIGYFKDFILLSEIESFCLPLLCEKCNRSQYQVVTPVEARALDPNQIGTRCPGCGADLILDEIPEQYLFFLRD